jgi:hypothetical protein
MFVERHIYMFVIVMSRHAHQVFPGDRDVTVTKCYVLVQLLIEIHSQWEQVPCTTYVEPYSICFSLQGMSIVQLK